MKVRLLGQAAENRFAASLGGSAPGANSALVDGVAADELAFGQITVSPSVDATDEFRLITHNADAQYGHTGGGVVSIVTKSGTNDLHGALFEFTRNRDLNANNFFANRIGTPRSPLTYNDYGLAFGGPVVLPKIYNATTGLFSSSIGNSTSSARRRRHSAQILRLVLRSPESSPHRHPPRLGFCALASMLPTRRHSCRSGRTTHENVVFYSPWHTRIACVGVLVLFTGGVGCFQHALAFTSFQA